MNDFIDMNSMQFSIEYDPTLMELTGMTPVNLANLFNMSTKSGYHHIVLG